MGNKRLKGCKIPWAKPPGILQLFNSLFITCYHLKLTAMVFPLRYCCRNFLQNQANIFKIRLIEQATNGLL